MKGQHPRTSLQMDGSHTLECLWLTWQGSWEHGFLGCAPELLDAAGLRRGQTVALSDRFPGGAALGPGAPFEKSALKRCSGGTEPFGSVDFSWSRSRSRSHPSSAGPRPVTEQSSPSRGLPAAAESLWCHGSSVLCFAPEVCVLCNAFLLSWDFIVMFINAVNSSEEGMERTWKKMCLENLLKAFHLTGFHLPCPGETGAVWWGICARSSRGRGRWRTGRCTHLGKWEQKDTALRY